MEINKIIKGIIMYFKIENRYKLIGIYEDREYKEFHLVELKESKQFFLSSLR